MNLRRRLALLIAAVSMVAACGTSEPLDDDLSVRTNERNVAQARHTFDLAVEQWERQQPMAHTLTTYFGTFAELEIAYDVDGNVLSEELRHDDAGVGQVDFLPRSVDAAFAEIDALIRLFETGEREVPEDDECGHHFNVRYDATLGNPTSYDTLGPCDDGVGLELSVRVDG